MVAGEFQADGVAKVLIEAEADLDARNERVRPVGVRACMHADVTLRRIEAPR